MILYWQQVAEAEHRVSENLNLKLTVRWMNCSVLDMYANRLPMERYTVSEKNREVCRIWREFKKSVQDFTV